MNFITGQSVLAKIHEKPLWDGFGKPARSEQVPTCSDTFWYWNIYKSPISIIANQAVLLLAWH